jgi:hypothetical protein
MRYVEDSKRRRDEAFCNLCDSFELNDPKCTDFHMIGPDGYGRRLGEALRNNTNVSSLCLNVSNFFAQDEVNTESATLLILFIRSSASLRRVGTTNFYLEQTTPLIAALVDQIWNAVAENPCITTVESHNVAQSLISLPYVLRTTQSVRKLCLSMLVPWTENVDGQQLAAAIRANTSLEDVTIASFCG